MEACNIFPPTQQFRDSLKKLNGLDEKVCLDLFVDLAKRMTEEEQISSVKGTSGSSVSNQVEHEETLKIVLERVAHFPVKPSVMEAELTQLGVSPSLGRGLANIWASVAKPLVQHRRRVITNFKGIHCQVLRDIPSGQERVKMQLNIEQQTDLKLSFKPEQLFDFYQELELIQANLDRICQ